MKQFNNVTMNFSFCPKCGSKLQSKKLSSEEKERLVCSNKSCGFIFYQNPKPTVFGLIEKDNQVLLIKRAINPFKDDWDLPGGFIELDETFEQALAREIKEEINLDIKSQQYFTSAITPYLNQDDNELGENLGVCFLVEPKNFNFIPGDDASQIKFFPWDKLPENIADFTDVKFALKKRQKEVLKKPSLLKEGSQVEDMAGRFSGQIKIGIGVIIQNSQNQALFIQRKGAHGEGEWAFPGGKLDFGEKIIDCAKREVFEEIGLKIKNIKIITVNEDFEYLEKTGIHWITFGCQTSSFSSSPKINEPDKISQFKWFSLDKLPTPIFPPTNRTLTCFIKNKTSLIKEEAKS